MNYRWVAGLAVCLASVASGREAVRWTPPRIATDQYESSPTFSPDGREMFLFRGDPTFSRGPALAAGLQALK